MGRITDEKKAFEACNCYKINPWGAETPDNLICYSPGIIGTLTDKQDEQCKKINIKPTPRHLRRHFEKFKEMGSIMKVCLKDDEGKTTDEFYDCIGREAAMQSDKPDRSDTEKKKKTEENN
jgi:hypothetical protein